MFSIHLAEEINFSDKISLIAINLCMWNCDCMIITSLLWTWFYPGRRYKMKPPRRSSSGDIYRMWVDSLQFVFYLMAVPVTYIPPCGRSFLPVLEVKLINGGVCVLTGMMHFWSASRNRIIPIFMFCFIFVLFCIHFVADLIWHSFQQILFRIHFNLIWLECDFLSDSDSRFAPE